MRISTFFAALGLLLLLPGVAAAQEETATAIFAGGCFWCVEADFDKVEGVTETVSGYIGGDTENPTYENHSAAGHREAVKITYDPSVTDYWALLQTFWRTIDPTDDGGQFCDRGHSYTTAVYALNEEQAEVADRSRASAEEALGKEIVTEIVVGKTFWPAEDYHQGYYKKNPVRYNFYRNACGRDQRIEELWRGQAMMGVAGH